MTTTKLKQALHSKIDNLNDDHVLKLINEIISQIMKDKKQSWDSLSAEERKSIETGLKQFDNGEGIDYNDVKKNFNEWIGK